MARLPIPGGDSGSWGNVLNDYLSQTHNADGTLKAGTVTSASIANGSISEAHLDTGAQTKLNAVAGTPNWSTITNKPAVIAAGVDQTAARAVIGAGTSDLAIGTTSSTAKAGDYQPASTNISDSTATGRSLLTTASAAAAKTTLSLAKADVGLANVDNTSDATKNSAVATLTNKTISGGSNTISGLGVSTLSASGSPSSTTYLRGDNTWSTPPAGGGGSGDASSNTSSSVDGEVALFSGTAGKTIKRATGSGVAKLTSGVLGTATAGTDYSTSASTETLTNKTISGSSNTISNIAESSVTNLTTDLAGKMPSTYLRATRVSLYRDATTNPNWVDNAGTTIAPANVHAAGFGIYFECQEGYEPAVGTANGQAKAGRDLVFQINM